MRIFTLVYVALLAFVSYGAIILFSEGLVLPDLSLVVFLSILSLVNYVFRSYRWKLLLEHYGMRVSLVEAIKTYIAGLLFIVTPAKAGEVVKAELMYKRHGFSRKTVGFIVIVERVFDMLAHLFIGGITALLVATGYVTSVWGIFAVLIIGIGLLYFFRRKLSIIQDELENLNDARLIVKSLILSIMGWVFEGIQVWLAVLYLGGQIGIAEAFFVFSASLIFGNLTFLPGGLGATEITSAGLLVLFGVAKGLASSVTLVTRFTTLWLGFGIGAVMWFMTFHKRL